MNFMFEWQEQYLTSERSERVRYFSCHENIKFISSSQRVPFFSLYGDFIPNNKRENCIKLTNEVEKADHNIPDRAYHVPVHKKTTAKDTYISIFHETTMKIV